jgi:hypothetical protein
MNRLRSRRQVQPRASLPQGDGSTSGHVRAELFFRARRDSQLVGAVVKVEEFMKGGVNLTPESRTAYIDPAIASNACLVAAYGPIVRNGDQTTDRAREYDFPWTSSPARSL